MSFFDFLRPKLNKLQNQGQIHDVAREALVELQKIRKKITDLRQKITSAKAQKIGTTTLERAKRDAEQKETELLHTLLTLPDALVLEEATTLGLRGLLLSYDRYKKAA
jgi:hypothetical protein